MINIVMLARNRHVLARQAFDSIFLNTGSFSLVVVDDGSEPSVEAVLPRTAVAGTKSLSILRVATSPHNLGALKNLGVYWSERMFGRGEWLAVFDNDICITEPRWVDRVGFQLAGKDRAIVGGCRHPFHGVNDWCGDFHVTDAVAGYSHFMRWDAWDAYGPYPETGGGGINRSEDFALCRRAVEDARLVGYLEPPVLVHTGITNSDGQPAFGSEHFLRVPGVLYE